MALKMRSADQLKRLREERVKLVNRLETDTLGDVARITLEGRLGIIERQIVQHEKIEKLWERVIQRG